MGEPLMPPAYPLVSRGTGGLHQPSTTAPGADLPEGGQK